VRKTASINGVSVKAYAGTTGVLLAMNIEASERQGLLGFAIERVDGRSGQKEWLSGTLSFPGMSHQPGNLIASHLAPIQKFRWSDYRVYPETTYKYSIHPIYGEPNRLQIGVGPTVTVTTASSQSEHYVLFNRAAAASQAFSRKFPEVEQQINEARKAKKPLPELPPPVLAWLSRGVLEQIVQLIERAADETWALDIAIYEYELSEIVQAVKAAYVRGVNVRIVYHAKNGDAQTEENEKNLEGLPATLKRARITSKICHHKFIVLSRLSQAERSPEAMLCGSTNFTHNGVYRQANVVHVTQDVVIAQYYLNLFEVLFQGKTPTETRDYINQNNPIENGQSAFAGFSPRSERTDLQAFVQTINGAKRDVLFCTAFDLYDELEAALLGKPRDPILRYGLQNSRSQITGIHADRTADFVATAMLTNGLEGFLKESTKGQRGNIVIHTKLIVVDFTSDNPIVISGSHNFSKAASESNDENFLVLRGNTDVADCYGCELMRLYDHYRFRFRLKDGKNEPSSQPAKLPALTPDDSWTQSYFALGSLKCHDRLRFVGLSD